MSINEQLHLRHNCLAEHERSATERVGVIVRWRQLEASRLENDKAKRQPGHASAHMHDLLFVLWHQPSWPKSANPASPYKPDKRRSYNDMTGTIKQTLWRPCKRLRQEAGQADEAVAKEAREASVCVAVAAEGGDARARSRHLIREELELR
jgi:hypothetical protein